MFSNPLSPGLRLVLGVAVCAALSACAAQPVEFHYNISGEQRVWPGAPEKPRYKYVGQLLGEQNFETKSGGIASVGTKVVKWIVGLGSVKPSGPAELQRPQGVAVDDRGRVYVSDISRQAVFVFDIAKGHLDIWQMADKDTRFKSPVGIALGADGHILVADADLHKVYRLDADGHPAGTLGDGYLQRPTGVARDPATGNVYVADTWAHHIQVFDPDGKLIKTIGGPGVAPGRFNRPTYLYIAHDRLYVSDTLNARVQVLTLDGKPLRTFGRRGIFVGDTPRPKGVATDNDGNIYVVESYYDYLLVFNAQGKLLLPIGGTGNAVGRFYLPAGVWIDKKQRVYIADMFNGRVVIFQYLGGA